MGPRALSISSGYKQAQNILNLPPAAVLSIILHVQIVYWQSSSLVEPSLEVLTPGHLLQPETDFVP